MTQKVDYGTASSKAVASDLLTRIEAIRLSRNQSQAALAKEAGISRSTMTRLADGQNISLDSFVRVMQALGLQDHLAALLPDPDIRPVERIRHGGSERKRASRKRSNPAVEWTWGDERSTE